jgi:hypothetical protein
MTQTKAQLQTEVDRLIKENQELTIRFEQLKTRNVHIFLETREGYLYLEHDLDGQMAYTTGIPRSVMEWVFKVLHTGQAGLLTDIGKEGKAVIDKLTGR